MTLSVFDIFKAGIGPSSSHTVGPMWAGNRFINDLRDKGILNSITGVRIGLYGSLALTGRGHATDKATVLGLAGYQPDLIDPDEADRAYDEIISSGNMMLAGEKEIPFDYDNQMVFHMGESLPEHPNAMRIYANDQNGIVVYYKTYFSIGGGFVVCADGLSPNHDSEEDSGPRVPYPFNSAEELLHQCKSNDITIAELMYANETALHECSREEVNSRIDGIWSIMNCCVERGLKKQGTMPISGIKRRAPNLYQNLLAHPDAVNDDHLIIMDWVTLFAMSVNEENACGGRIVTAPTNGAAGVIPAVITYYLRFIEGADHQGVRDFLLTAAAVGALYKMNASISGAEVGCQGEVGVACSMAAAGLAAVKGGTIDQIENAAEIGMEHHLGLTCDPIDGLVQIPCIERNCMGAIKSITSSRIALRGNGEHEVSLDSVIATMLQTGKDMQSKYRETSQGGLALYAHKHTVAC